MKSAPLRLRDALVAAVFCVNILVPSSAVRAAGPDQFKAAYLLNFARYTDWPKGTFASDLSPIRLCLLGTRAFFEIVRETVGDRTAGDRKVEVEARTSAAGAGECHIFYIGQSHKEAASAVIAETTGSNVLTVAEWPRFSQQGGIASFFLKEKKVRFAINASVAGDEELRISSRLLRIAEIVE